MNKIKTKVSVFLTKNFIKKKFNLKLSKPIISFTFDDFPRSAWLNAGKILSDFGVHGTFYVSMGLLGKDSPSGKIVGSYDLNDIIDQKHELGCHTFDHFNGRLTDNVVFEKSIIRNQESINSLCPEYKFKSFAYPFNGPSLKLKKIVGKHFDCCRIGGNSINKGIIDLYLLKSCFIDWRNNNNFDDIKRIVDFNAEVKGWLIFSTHDVSDRHSRYGCTYKYFEKIVQYSLNSGARINSVSEVCENLRIR